MDDDRVKPDAVKKGERGGEALERPLKDGAAHLDDRELLRVHTGVVAEVLLDLFPAAYIGQQLDDDVLRALHRVLAAFVGGG